MGKSTKSNVNPIKNVGKDAIETTKKFQMRKLIHELGGKQFSGKVRAEKSIH